MRYRVLTVMCLLALSACSGSGDDKSQAGAHAAGSGTGANAGADSGSPHTTMDAGHAGTLDAGQQHVDATVAQGADASAADGGTDAGTGSPFACKASVKANTFGNKCPTAAPVALKATRLTDAFEAPVFVTHAPGDSDTLYVVERFGTIRVVKSGTKLAEPLITLPAISTSSEQGLLGLAFDPDFETTGRFFVNYIQQITFGTQTVVESYTVKASDPNVADPTTKKLIITVEDPESNHNGGMIAFGPDNCLYVGTGDGGGGNDGHTNNGADGNGQSLTTGLGKLLRIDVDHPDDAAPGNLEGAGIPWIWDYGLRNPWRFSFDRDTGDLYIGDVGQNTWEEIDIAPRGHGHNNFGWKFFEGKHCRGDGKTAPTPASCSSHDYTDFAPPVHDYFHENGDNCVIGGYVYRGMAIPSLRGHYLFADHGSNHVWAMVWDGTKPCGAPIDISSQITVTGNIASFGEDADGELYITTHQGDSKSQPGYVYRIEAQ